MNILHRKNLGYLLDACQILTCKTASRETWINTLICTGSEEENLKTISYIMDYFDPVNPKMLLFGFRDSKKGSLIGNLFYDYADQFIDKWDSATFFDYLSNPDRLKQAISSFYLDEDYSDHTLSSISKNENLSSDLKALLFDFYLFPEDYIDLARKEFEKISIKLDIYYRDHIELLLKYQETFNYEVLLSRENTPFSKQRKWDKNIKTCYISCSLISKYTLARGKSGSLGWIVMGYDYVKTLDEIQNKPLDIAAFGNAFGDKLRVKIIEEIVKNGELTLADISKKLGVVNTIVIYHLDILKKENLLLHRHQGRKVLYCLNKRQIEKGLAAVRTLCGGDEQ